MSRIAILGPGGVGGFLAAALTEPDHGEGDGDGPHEVTVIAREATAVDLARVGITLHSRLLGERFVRPRVGTALTAPVDILFVTTKAGGLDEALERIVAEPGLVVPLLNGVEHLARLRERFGAERVPASVIRIESDRPAVGLIEQTSPGVRVDLAADNPAMAERLDPELGAPLREAGLDVRIGASEADVIWRKLARLCPLALTTTASDRAIGYVREDPRWRSALQSAVRETVAVANAEGAGLRASDTLAELDAAHPELGSSMRRDVHAGRPTELDAIAGAVMRAGRRNALRCPTVQWLAGEVVRRAGTQTGGRTGSGSEGAPGPST